MDIDKQKSKIEDLEDLTQKVEKIGLHCGFSVS